MKRPAVIATLLLIVGLVLGRFIVIPPVIILIALGLIIGGMALLLFRPRKADQVPPSGELLMVAFVLIGVFFQNGIERENAHDAAAIKAVQDIRQVELEGVVAGEPDERERNTQIVLKRCEVKTTPDDEEFELATQVLVAFTGQAKAAVDDLALARGDRVRVRGRLHEAPYLANPTLFNYRAFLRQRGICAVLRCYYPVNFALVSGVEERGIVARALRAIFLYKRTCVAMFERVAGKETAKVMEAMTLGRAHGLEAKEKERFVRTGLMHLFAVSGLHTGLVVLLLFIVLRFAGLRLKASSIGTIIGVLFFMALTGFRPTVVRAGIMAICFLGSFLLKRQVEPISTLAFAAFWVLLFNPRALGQVDFQLSYLSVLSILLFKPILEEILWLKRKGNELPLRGWMYVGNHYVLNPVHLLICVQLGLLPLLVHYYHTYSLVAVVANLLVVPLGFVLITISLLISTLGMAAYGVAQLLGHLAVWVVALIRWVSGAFASPSLAALHLRSFPWWLVGAYYLVLASGSYVIAGPGPIAAAKRKARFLLTLGFVVALLVWYPILQYAGSGLAVYFLNVGQGDSIYIEFPDGENMLVDGGTDFPTNMGKFVVRPFLQNRGVDELSVVVATHADRDHIGGLATVLENFFVGMVIEGNSNVDTAQYRELEEQMQNLAIPRHLVTRGDRLAGISGVEVMVLNPDEKMRGRLGRNNDSVVLRMRYRDVAILLTGDAETEAERGMVESGLELRSDLLKAGHHGSRSSSSEFFLKAVEPQVVVISVGARNRYGHPTQEVLERFKAIGAQIYRTDRDGAIIVRTNGERLQVSTMANDN
jgi:competence protein ComEC